MKKQPSNSKKVIFINQSKGGSGKSVLTFLLAEKYRKATIYDMDDDANTTSLQLAYRKPKKVTFLGEGDMMDRGIFSEFIEKLGSLATNDLYICDLGASISGQLPFYFSDLDETFPDILKELGVDMELYVVISGGANFLSTYTYLQALHKNTKGQFKITIWRNKLAGFVDSQKVMLEKFAGENNLKIKEFTISESTGSSVQKRIQEVLKSGQGIDGASSITKMYFSLSLKNIVIDDYHPQEQEA